MELDVVEVLVFVVLVEVVVVLDDAKFRSQIKGRNALKYIY